MAGWWWRSPRWRWPAGSGATLAEQPDRDCPDHAFWFGEDQGRYVIAVKAEQAAAAVVRANALALAASDLGSIGGDAISLDGQSVSLQSLARQPPGLAAELHGRLSHIRPVRPSRCGPVVATQSSRSAASLLATPG